LQGENDDVKQESHRTGDPTRLFRDSRSPHVRSLIDCYLPQEIEIRKHLSGAEDHAGQ
jgi:hypothetical protein